MFQMLIQSFSGLSLRIWLLALVNFINRIGAMVICFLTLYLTEYLHYSLTEAGYALTFYGMGAVGGNYLGGYLTDKIGYQKVQMGSLFGSGVMLIVILYLKDFYWMCGILFVYSLISEMFRPANLIAVKINSEEHNRTRAFSLLRTSFNLAITFALTLGGLLIMQGWYFIFVVDALTCFAAFLILFFFIPEVSVPKASKPIPSDTNESSPYQDKIFLYFIVLTFLNALVFMQIIWTVPYFFKEVYHWTEDKIGVVSAINGFMVMLIEIPLIFMIEPRKPAFEWVRWGLVLYGVSYLCLLIPLTWIPAVLYMVFISLGEILVMPFSTSWITKRATEQGQGKYMGMYAIAYSLANTVAPFLGTQIINRFGYNVLWIAICIISVGVWGGFYYIEKEEKSA